MCLCSLLKMLSLRWRPQQVKRTSEARTLTTASWTSACGRDLVSASQPSTVVTLQVLLLLLTWQLQVWQANVHPRAAPTCGLLALASMASAALV